MDSSKNITCASATVEKIDARPPTEKCNVFKTLIIENFGVSDQKLKLKYSENWSFVLIF